MRKPLLAANWKMNQTRMGVNDYFTSFFSSAAADWSRLLQSVDVCFSVPYLLLDEALKALGSSGISVAAQNAHFEQAGAYTGEISLGMLQEVGIQQVVLGHSERRQYFAETDEIVALKVKAALSSEFLPIICVGESLSERQEGGTKAVVKRQIEAFVDKLSESDDVVIAYEPVWAIGTGLAATSAQAQEVHAYIRSILAAAVSNEFANRTRILYGGSMNGKNVGELFQQQDIDGGLVGGASLKPEEFAGMIGAIQALETQK